MTVRRVLSVGQCRPDQYALTRTLQAHFTVEVEAADTAPEALARLRAGTYALVLVNRVFDLDSDSGLRFIEELRGDEQLRTTPVMLVSNHDDAQAQAAELGAAPGFGKGALGQPAMLDRLRPFLD
jgi:CheY-like chemotaxis protein